MILRGQVQPLAVLILVVMLGLEAACSSVPVQADLFFVNPPRRLAAHQKKPASDVAVVVSSSAGHGSVPPPPIEQKLDEGVKGAGNPAMQDMDVASRKPTPVGGSFHVDYNSPVKHPPKNN